MNILPSSVRDFAGVIKLKIFRQGVYSSSYNVITRVLVKGRQKDKSNRKCEDTEYPLRKRSNVLGWELLSLWQMQERLEKASHPKSGRQKPFLSNSIANIFRVGGVTKEHMETNVKSVLRFIPFILKSVLIIYRLKDWENFLLTALHYTINVNQISLVFKKSQLMLKSLNSCQMKSCVQELFWAVNGLRPSEALLINTMQQK